MFKNVFLGPDTPASRLAFLQIYEHSLRTKFFVTRTYISQFTNQVITIS